MSTTHVSVVAGGFRYVLGMVYGSYHFLVGQIIGYSYLFLLEVFVKFKKVDLQEIPSRKGDVAVITGGAAGIGYEALKKLLAAEFHVIMGVRNLEKGKQAKDKIREEGITTGILEYLELELTSLDSVRKFSEMVLAKTNKIHLLINNAGIMIVPFAITKDNMESQFQVNYLSHFLLTNLLLPTMIKTGATSDKCCRIINTSSILHFGGNINFDDLQNSKMYSSYKAYFDSKLAIIMNTKYLDRQMVEAATNVRVYSLHPGIIPSTKLFDGNILLKLTKYVARLSPIFRTEKDGGEAIIYAALSPDIENTGGIFLLNNKQYEPNRTADYKSLQERLWQVSLKLVGLNVIHKNMY